MSLDAAPATNLRDGCVANEKPGVDYFPEKARFRYSKQLTVEYHGAYKTVTFTPAVNTHEVFHLLLYQCGTVPPATDRRTRVIAVPAKRFVLQDAGYGSTVVRLGLLAQMTGVNSLKAFSEPHIVEAGRAGKILEVGSNEHASLESAVSIDPDLVFLFYSAYPNSNLHPKLWEAGVQAVPLADHFEPTPVGRAEWVKLFAMLFNRERDAEEIFAPAAARYEALARRAESVQTRPEVLLGYASGRDNWVVNGGKNFMSQLIYDAGGQYFWHDNLAGTLIFTDYERVLDQSQPADMWFGGVGVIRAGSIQALIKNDPRLAFFTPVSLGRVEAADRGLDKRGAFPFADQSLDKPDELLADLMEALHPDLLPGRLPEFYRRLK